MSTPSCQTCGGHRSGTCCDCGYTGEASRHAETRRLLGNLVAAFDSLGQIRRNNLHDLNPSDLFGPHSEGCRACVLEAAFKDVSK